MTTGTGQRRARRAQLSTEFARLREELNKWFQLWQAPQAHGFRIKHGRQLQRLQSMLFEALAALERALKNFSLDPPTDAVYRKCREFELRLIWVRRIWTYYRAKFEQRLEPGLQPLLQAADEVVWACYAPAFRSLGLEPPPPPLPYIEPQFAPRAIPREEPPPELKSEVDSEFRQQMLEMLPVSVIGLPPACVTAPWWLAHVAHETGHLLEYELGLNVPFRQVLKAAATAQLSTEDEGAADKWTLWNEEIFADLFSILCLGPAAPRSLAEIELTSQSMGAGFGRYPASVVRFELMRQGLSELKVSDEGALGTAMDQQFREVCRVLPAATAAAFEIAKPVAAAALRTTLRETQTLVGLSSFDETVFQDAGRQQDWVNLLRKGEQLSEPATPVTVRELLVAAVVAWDQVLEVADETESVQEEANLRQAVLSNLPAHAEPGDRAAGTEPVTDSGRRLADLLLSRSANQLGV